MIPKKIHYVWLGGSPLTELGQKCLDSWKKFCPDYEIVCWNESNFDLNSVKWVKQATEQKKWAFAADYIRFWVIYNYGGIYLDSDVEFLRPLGDKLMELPYFLGMEKTKQLIESATFGAEPKCAWVKDCLDYYEDRNFEIGKNILDMEPVPSIMRKILKKKYGFLRVKSPAEFNFDSKQIQLLPPDYFSPKRWSAKVANVTKNTYSIHHFGGSWVDGKKGLVAKLAIKILGEKLYLNLLWYIYGK